MLDRVLTPANLRYRKLKGGGYTILPRRAEKALPAQSDLLKTTDSQPMDGGLSQPLALNTLAAKTGPMVGSSARTAEIVVRGKVTDSDKGDPIPGASIVLKGATKGTNSDADGNYSITVPDAGAVLVYSFVGYDTQEATVGNRTQINIVLKSRRQRPQRGCCCWFRYPEKSHRYGGHFVRIDQRPAAVAGGQHQ